MRVSRDQMLMEVAQVIARRGTCSRKQVGIVVARDGRVLVTGYNGAPAGLPHCSHENLSGLELIERGGRWSELLGEGSYSDERLAKTWYLTQVGPEITMSSQEGCSVAVHAEANTIAFAARHGIRLEGGQLYTTCSPCVTCAKLIINAGIQCVVSKEYYRDPKGAHLLTEVGIEVRVLA